MRMIGMGLEKMVNVEQEEEERGRIKRRKV